MACQKINYNPFYGPTTTMYDDPIQGAQDNCSLIAALSSVAWVTQKKKFDCGLDAGTQKYNVKFANVNPLPQVSNDLDPLNAHSSQNEIWVGLYEKAYAQQFCKPYPQNPCPIAGVQWPGNASPPLVSLIGCNIFTEITDFYNKIVGICLDNKTKYPTVIWTKDQLPAGTDKALRSRHSYSVLGYTGDYVILRDPKRALPDTIPQNSPNCMLQGTFKFGNNFVATICPGAQWTPGTPLTAVTVTFGVNGIVGVHKAKMSDTTWFAGMSYGH